MSCTVTLVQYVFLTLSIFTATLGGKNIMEVLFSCHSETLKLLIYQSVEKCLSYVYMFTTSSG